MPYFLILLVLYWFSKSDYLWLSYMFLFMQAPGGLFESPYNSAITLTSTVSISFTYVFMILSFIKAILKPGLKKNKYAFKQIKIIPYYMIFLFLISLIYGMDSKAWAFVFYILVSIIFFTVLPVYLNDKVAIIGLVKILFFSMIILFIWQIHDVVFAKKIAEYFTKSSLATTGFDWQFNIWRVFYAAGISLVSFYFALYYLLDPIKAPLKRNYLSLIAIFSFLGIALTATRGYILQYLFILSGFFLLSVKRGSKIITLLVSVVFLTVAILPSVSKQLESVISRLSTISSIVQGDSTADGTLVRISERGPRVWKKFVESPIWGFGFSSEELDITDGHVGNYSLLLQGGIIGFLIYIYVNWAVLKKLYQKYNINKKMKQNYFTICFLISLIIAHSTSSMFFTYYFEPHIVMIMGTILIFIQAEVMNS